MKRIVPLLCFLPGLILAGPVVAAEWGDLRGQIVYDGEPPEQKKLEITKDKDECCKHDLVDESLVVDSQTRGLRNVVVYLMPRRGQQVPVHASYREQVDQQVKLDNRGCRFDPRVVLFWTPRTLSIENSDPIGHNAMIDARKNAPLSVTIPSGGTHEHRFPNQELGPVAVSCSMHPWMRGWMLIRDTPYMAVTDKDGRFEIKNVPVGSWDFIFWHERAMFLTEVTREGKPVEWKRGRAELSIHSGKNELGVVIVKPSQFK